MPVKKAVKTGVYTDLSSALRDVLENIARGMSTAGREMTEQAEMKEPKKRKSKLDPKPH